MDRTYVELNNKHLELLKNYSLQEFDRLIKDVAAGKYRVYENKLIAICLCQGAAQHVVESKGLSECDHTDPVSKDEIDSKNLRVDETNQVLSGIKDFDIWFFFEDDENIKIPNPRNMRKSIEVEIPGMGSRIIDFMKKGVGNRKSGYSVNKPKDSIIQYLTKRGTPAANNLKRKSVIAIYPESIAGDVMWSVKRVRET